MIEFEFEMEAKNFLLKMKTKFQIQWQERVNRTEDSFKRRQEIFVEADDVISYTKSKNSKQTGHWISKTENFALQTEDSVSTVKTRKFQLDCGQLQ